MPMPIVDTYRKPLAEQQACAGNPLLPQNQALLHTLQAGSDPPQVTLSPCCPTYTEEG